MCIMLLLGDEIFVLFCVVEASRNVGPMILPMQHQCKLTLATCNQSVPVLLVVIISVLYVNQSKYLLHVTFVSLVGNAYIHVYCDQFVVFSFGVQWVFFYSSH